MTSVDPQLPAMRRGWGWSLCAGLAGAFLLLLMARGVIQHPPHYDELLHALSARGLVESGAPVIADGRYVRAQAYTQLVAWSYVAFGDSLLSARLPALAAGTLLVLSMGVWVTRQAGFVAGLATALLICAVPSTLDVSVFARFYTLHALFIALIFMALFAVAGPGRPLAWRLVLVAAVAAVFPFAKSLQQSTIVAVGVAVGATVMVAVLDSWITVRAWVVRRPVVTAAVMGLVMAVGLLLAWQLGLFEQFRSAPLWAARDAGRLQYYIVAFREELPLLWPLLPVATLLAVTDPARQRLAVFCVVIVLAVLLVHSLAAQKSVRYVYYMVPWMCGIWALALARVIEAGGRYAGSRGGLAGGRLLRLAGVAALGLTLLFSVEGARTLNVAAGRLAQLDRLPFKDEPDWRPVMDAIRDRAAAVDRVVTSNAMKALYHLGRYDYELNATIVPETDTFQDFGIDDRTGRPAIGRADSIARVLDLPGTTLVVLETEKLGRTSGVSAEALAVIVARCAELDLAAQAGVRAWWCDRPNANPGDDPGIPPSGSR